MSGTGPRLRARPLLLAEALLALMLASAMIALLPFRRVARVAAGQGRAGRASASPAEAALIAAAVAAWAARVPWRAMCFECGLAALLMLRRRRRAVTLYYGAAHAEDGRLVAHVWVRSGSIDVSGCDVAADFGVLAAFPAPVAP